jgi:hypothetical protein
MKAPFKCVFLELIQMMMIRIFFVLLFIGSISFHGHGQRRLLTQGTAFSLGRKDLHLAVFHPSVYGFSPKFEISSTLIGIPLYLNITPKYVWYSSDSWAVASEHSIWSPTPLFRILPDIPGFESYPSKDLIPATMGFNSKVLLSYGWGETDCPSFTGQEFNRANTFKGNTSIVTLQLGAQSGIVLSDYSFPMIHEGVIYQRTSFLNQDLSWFAGLGFDTRFRTNYDLSFDLNYIGLPASAYALEHRGAIQLYWWKFFHILIGYHASYVQTTDRNIFFATPVIDLQWTLRKDKLQYGLFGKKMF